MKRILLIALIALSGCYVTNPRYIDLNDPIRQSIPQSRWWWYQDPLYWGYPAPHFYRQPIIINPAPRVVVPRAPQQPRQYNLNPQPQPPVKREGSAPIRTFPKNEDKK